MKATFISVLARFQGSVCVPVGTDRRSHQDWDCSLG